ncbi:peptidoglycan DD-metalloendopeptidase family protein [Candidatus Puniceispirillum sp.]|nr:peptidoglycan DD-metalloendopeptidase family protein [Candidatus Puniceispirillum sp.]
MLCLAHADTRVSGESKQAAQDTPASMRPVIQTKPVLPTSRPDKALAYPSNPVSITLPVPKPALEDILPRSTATIGEMIRKQTGLNAVDEVQLSLRAGEGIGALLQRGGYDSIKISAAVNAIAGKASLRRLQIGTKFQVTDKGFRFMAKPGRDVYVIHYPDNGWVALTALRPIESYVSFFQGAVDRSIYKSAMAAGVSEAAYTEYVRVMGFSVDFQREIRTGDRFELLYETDRDSIDGKRIGGRLHYAGLVLSDQRLGFFRYDEADDVVGWYDEEGNSAARTLIRTPIAGARLSSSFGRRKHPVSGFNAMHKGVDFAAPLGTPIIAAGSGVIRESGWKGSFGRYIRIKHNATYDTAYAHMKSIAPQIRVGTYVRQGEVIGFVGSTGRSTGAHLHYEILVNNRQVNPMTVRLPTGKRIDSQHLEAFKKVVTKIDKEVLSRGTLRFAGVDNKKITE